MCRLTKVMTYRNYYEGDLETDKSAQNIKVAAIYFCVVMNFPTLPFFYIWPLDLNKSSNPIDPICVEITAAVPRAAAGCRLS